jgi:bifunctional non-homologous end joining protein LigD
MAATLVRELPDSDVWLYEVKLDGYRALIIKDQNEVSLISRNRKNLTCMYPSIVATAHEMDAEQAVIDGEIVALDPTGRPSFQALQRFAWKV